MSDACDQFVMEDQSCDCFDMVEYVQSFDMGINFLLGPPTPSEVIFTPHVSEDGTLSWTNDGGLPNPDPVNIMGPPGESPVQSVNGKTGAVELDKTDVGLGNVANVLQYSANNPPPYPVTSVNGKTGAAVLPYSNLNLLENWYFVGGGSQLGENVFPVNQRGQTSYGAGIVGIDCWTADAGITLTASGITLSSNSQIYQNRDANFYKRLIGKTITISAIIDGVLHYGSLICPTVPASTTVYSTGDSAIRMAVYGDGACQLARILADANKVISAVKVELGSSQTLAHQENGVWVLNEFPNYSEELAKCQREFIRFPTSSFQFPALTAASGVNIEFSMPQPMKRGTVTISGSPTFTFKCGGQQYQASTYVSKTQDSMGHINVTYKLASAAPANETGVLWISSGYMDVSVK